ncbi:MAG: hypothetical protein HBSAPP01_10250 [Candidatus Brocadia sapporoensis]|nr:MAG: hypothetical protein HBSAPP01_10250 [Candidatus Brocadia sapporoensis]
MSNGRLKRDNCQLPTVNTQLKKGYKQSEVGVIPSDWEVKRLGDAAEVVMGQSPIGASYNRCCIGAPLINGPTEFTAKHPIKIQWTSQPTKFCKKGDVLLCVRGSSTGRINISDDEYCIGRGIASIRAKSGVDTSFITFQVESAVKNILVLTTGSTFPNIDGKSIKAINVLIPPTKAEQNAIATVLSDADALISSLEKLIAKKRNIKQGAMQQLLTGKKRLPGFSGKWEVKKLGNLGKFRGGSGFPIKHQGKVEGDYPFFKVSDMNNEGNTTFMANSNNWISEFVRKEASVNVFPRHSIIFAKIGAAIFLERKKILLQESCIDNNMMGFVLDEDCTDFKFIYYLFLNIQLGKLVSTTALPSLSGREIATLEFGIPEFKEQTAIAQVLSDMDAEIEALEKKLDKFRMIKQGMMQELLSGRTRLI